MCLMARNLCCIAHYGFYAARHSAPDRLVCYLQCLLTSAVFSVIYSLGIQEHGVAMNEREAIQRELSQERRTMQRQALLKRLRKLEVENERYPLVEQGYVRSKAHLLDFGQQSRENRTMVFRTTAGQTPVRTTNQIYKKT
jgi:hypothetical protein